MMSFRSGRLRRLSLPLSSVWMMTDLAEAKGRQQLLIQRPPQVLRALMETARIQSVESSNRIEGVTVPPARLRPLVLHDARPRDRSEEEIQGYRRALDLVNDRAADLAITPELLRRLHGMTLEGSGDAGRWKSADNEIVELRPDGPPIVRFRPVAVGETPAAVEELCHSYGSSIERGEVPALVAVASLILDFLCIHPFRDGNGRVSRLLTLLALYQQGYLVGGYVSLERLVEETRDRYYDVLHQSSQGWHDGDHDLVPWLSYTLGILRRAYRELEERVEGLRLARGAKTAMIQAAVDELPPEFSRADLKRACPGVSTDLVRKILRRLHKEGRVEAVGRGPGALWRKRK